MPFGVGLRKFTIAGGTVVLVLGLSFWALLVGDLESADFVKSIYASCSLAGAYCGVNLAGSVLGGKK